MSAATTGVLTLATATRGQGPALVCVPGGPGMHPAYLSSLFKLSTRLVVTLVHLRGTGDSPRPAQSDAYGLDAYANDVIALLLASAGEHGGRPVLLLGHSHGGLVALRVAARRPDLVRGLVLLATPSYGGTRAESEAEAAQRSRLHEPACRDAWGALEKAGGSYPPESELGALIAAVAPLWLGPMTARSRRWQAQVALQRCNLDALRHFNEFVFSGIAGFVREDLSMIRCPVLALTGDLDGWAGPAHLAELVHYGPAVRPVLLKGAGHMCHIDALDQIAAEISTFDTDTERTRTA